MKQQFLWAQCVSCALATNQIARFINGRIESAVAHLGVVLKVLKDSRRLRLSSNYALAPWWVFRKDRIVGVNWRWFSLLVGLKRDGDKTRSILCSCAGFLLSPCPSSPLSYNFFPCSLEIGFLAFLIGSSRPAMSPDFWVVFKCANAIFDSVKA